MTSILIKQSNTYNRGKASILGTVDLPNYEISFLRQPGWREVWTADSRCGQARGRFRWIGRLQDKELICDAPPAVTIDPVASNITALSGRPGLIIGAAAKRLVDPAGQAYIPTASDWSVFGIVDPANNYTANWHTLGTTGSGSTFLALVMRTDGKFQLFRNGTSIGISTLVHTGGAPFYFTLSWEQAATRAILRVNGVQWISVTSALANTVSQMVVGVSQVGTGPGAGNKAYACVGVSNLALGAAANAAALAVVEAYPAQRYGAVFV